MEAWIRSVGTTTLPLLAGFSITAVVVVAGHAAVFLWPGVKVFLLTVAAVAVMIAVQHAYQACMYFSEDRRVLVLTRCGIGLGIRGGLTVLVFCCGEGECPGSTYWAWNDSAPAN